MPKNKYKELQIRFRLTFSVGDTTRAISKLVLSKTNNIGGQH